MPNDNGNSSKFGRTLAETLVEVNASAPVRVAVVELPDGQRKLEIRRMYYRGGVLKFGKGMRVKLGALMEESEFSAVMDAVEKVLDDALGDASDYWHGFPGIPDLRDI